MGYLLVTLAVLLATAAACSEQVPPPPQTAAPTPPPSVGAAGVVEVDGYSFEVTVLRDPTFGPNPSAPWAWSPIPGIGLRCAWTRTGPVPRSAVQLWGTPNDVREIAGSAPPSSGMKELRESGLPRDALTATDRAEVICGLRDSAGDHGVRVVLILERRGESYVVTQTDVLPWRR